MAKYVELDKIMQFPIRRDHYDRENGDPHFINGIETMMEYIETLPTIDAVPVEWIKEHYGECERVKQMLREWEDNGDNV